MRRLVDSMGQLSLGTIDGFFNRIIMMFSLEFGLGGEFGMMSEFEQQQARMLVLEMLLEENTARREDRGSLIETFRLSTAGKDDRRFVRSFEQYLENCHELWLRVPDPSRWGDPDRLCPKPLGGKMIIFESVMPEDIFFISLIISQMLLLSFQ